MTRGADRVDAAFDIIDAANAEDPNQVEGPGGLLPKEIAHSRAMTRWVLHLAPDATDEQLVAARAHHFRRWTRPRNAYPEGRAGYLRWRSEARRAHAREVALALEGVGFSDEEMEAICDLIAKTGDAADAAQVHEDALCLVFLQWQAEGTAQKLGRDRSEVVLRRTLAKMSPRARTEGRRLVASTPLAGVVDEICSELNET